MYNHVVWWIDAALVKQPFVVQMNAVSDKYSTRQQQHNWLSLDLDSGSLDFNLS